MEEIRALFIGAHNDECEYGTGGLAYLLQRQGVRVRFYNTCVLRAEDNAQTLAQKTRVAMEAAAMLGAEKRLEQGGAMVWCASEAHVEHILNEILDFRPQLVFLHFPRDTHEEHREVARASYAAVCMAPARGWHCSEIYAFEAGPDQTVQYMSPDFVIDISDVMPTLEACYHHFGQSLGDQLTQEKRTGAAFRGLKCGFAYFEAYNIFKFPEIGRAHV